MSTQALINRRKVIHIYIMLKDDQEDIQASESICQIKRRYITTNPYVQDDQNNHGKDRNHYAKRNEMNS